MMTVEESAAATAEIERVPAPSRHRKAERGKEGDAQHRPADDLGGRACRG